MRGDLDQSHKEDVKQVVEKHHHDTEAEGKDFEPATAIILGMPGNSALSEAFFEIVLDDIVN